MQQERGQGRVGGEGDAGQGPGGEDLRGRGGEAGGRLGAGGRRAEEQVFGPVEDAHGTVGAWWRGVGEAELAGGDGAVVGGAGSEFGPAEQAGGFRVGGGGGDLAGRAGLAELAAGEDGEVGADGQCFVAVVGDVDGGDVQGGQEFGQQRAQVFAGGLVEGGQGLIEQQQAGLDGQRPGQGDPLAFAAGQRSRGPGGQRA